MKDEWGPWIEHNGSGCPCNNTFVEVVMLDGDHDEAEANDFCWKHSDLGGFFPGYIIRYRIRKPRGMVVLEALLQNLPQEVEA